jgi:L-aspartate oxidase
LNNQLMESQQVKTEVLVIGSGIAGLSFAIKMAVKYPDKKVMVLTKTVEGESNTKYAQGGVAAVWDFSKDSYQKHIEDTLDAGDGLCNKEIVEIVVKEGPERVKELITYGARFDKAKSQDYDLGKEGGHSENRILHYKDLTGWEMQRALMEEAALLENIEVVQHYFVIDLITQHHLGHMVSRISKDTRCYGVYVLDKKSNKIITILSKITLVATGGIGQVYKATTNPVIASGDGIAMFYRAKGHVANMEFVQFHPTSLYNPAGENPAFLITEAIRGFGGILKTKDGKEFMQHYDERASLAPRDIVARAIDSEMKKSGDDFVALDCTHLDPEGFKAHFPTIYEKCLSLGIDPMKDMIPVVPAAHYSCGGILTDANGRTNMRNLYACGECTNTGLHGANRLASNSLLEAMVFAHRIFEDSVGILDNIEYADGIPDWNAEGTTDPKEMVLITQSLKELKDIMSTYVGIVRSNIRLKRALDRLWLLYQETEDLYHKTTISPQLCELRNLITIAYLVTRSANMRKESRGLHFTTDYPERLPFAEDSLL